jgi:hypothetical protein
MNPNGQYLRAETDRLGLEQQPPPTYYSFRSTQFGISLPGTLRHACVVIDVARQ